MGNKRLIIISYIYITYYYLATKKFNIANKRLRAISADVVSSNDILLHKVLYSAITRLERAESNQIGDKNKLNSLF